MRRILTLTTYFLLITTLITTAGAIINDATGNELLQTPE